MLKRFLALLFLLIGVLASTGCAPRAEESPPIPITDDSTVTLNIEPSKTTVEGMEPLTLKLTLQNSSADRVVVAERVAETDFAFVITDWEGHATTLTRAGAAVAQLAQGPSSLHGVVIPPGQSIERSIVINRLYDMTLGGEYTIQATAGLGKGSKAMRIQSKTIKVVVK